MIGWKIFYHALRMLLVNRKQAVKISFLPFLASTGLIYWLMRALNVLPSAEGLGSVSFNTPVPGFWSIFFIVIVAILLTIWIAVAWHRFILLEEAQTSILPQWRGKAIFQYFLGLLVLVAVFISMIIVLVFLTSWLLRLTYELGVGGFVFQLTSPISVILAAYLFFRLSMILPAVALGQPVHLVESWRLTKSIAAQLWIFVIAYSVFGFLINFLSESLIAAALFGGVPFLAAALQFVFGWFTFMLGLSVLTTIYGYVVEGRKFA